MSKRYAVVIEKGEGNGAYVPDLPGCVATGTTIEEVEREIQEAIEFHLEGACAPTGCRSRAGGSAVKYVEVTA